MKPTTIADLCTDLLKACVDAYAAENVDQQAPQRQLVTHGPPVWDAEQIAVCWNGLKAVRPFPTSDPSPLPTVVVPAADLTVEVVRKCWPTAATPSVASITDASLALAADAAALFSHIGYLAATGTLFPSVGGICPSDIAVGTVVPLAPAGAMAGLRWPILVKLTIP